MSADVNSGTNFFSKITGYDVNKIYDSSNEEQEECAWDFTQGVGEQAASEYSYSEDCDCDFTPGTDTQVSGEYSYYSLVETEETDGFDMEG